MINMGSARTLNHCTFQREIEVLIEESAEIVPNKLAIPVERKYQAIKRTRMLNDLRMMFFMSIYVPLSFTGLMGRMSGCPAGASVSIRFDGSRCFRARHQDRRASAPMARAKRGPSRGSRAALWRVAVDPQVICPIIFGHKIITTRTKQTLNWIK
jgi:hypothetical protein